MYQMQVYVNNSSENESELHSIDIIPALYQCQAQIWNLIGINILTLNE